MHLPVRAFCGQLMLRFRLMLSLAPALALVVACSGPVPGIPSASSVMAAASTCHGR